jgi:hypothetical protein
MCPAALADLNVYEAAAGGEFGIGSAQQYGEADIQGRDFSNQASFCSADRRSVHQNMAFHCTVCHVIMPMGYIVGSAAVGLSSTARPAMCGDEEGAAACPMCCMWLIT